MVKLLNTSKNLSKRGIETPVPSFITLADFKDLINHSKLIKVRLIKKG